MYKTALICLGLDSRDKLLVKSFIAAAPKFGVQRVILLHVHAHDLAPFEIVGAPTINDKKSGFIKKLTDEISAKLPNIQVVGMIAVGIPYEKIVKVIDTEKVDLVVLARDAQPIELSEKGRHGRDILRYSDCTVLVVPEGSTLAFNKGVVGIDFSICSTEAAKIATTLFDNTVGVYSYQIDPGLSYGGLTTEEFVDGFESSAKEHYQNEVLTIINSEMPFEIIQSERASEALIRRSDELSADCIVIGGYGRTKLAAMLLGSTAERLASRSLVPVLIVRVKGERKGLLASLISR